MGIADSGNTPFDDDGLARHIEKLLKVKAPKISEDHWSYKTLKWLFQPTLINTYNLPDKPCLFVANHSLFALDGPIISGPLLVEHNRFLRPLADKFLWTPNSESFLLRQGATIGHPDVCSALMESGNDILLFPGGAHEATKTSDEKYTLQWKQRYGFVKLAAKHGYTIMPTAVVGPDEFYDHLIEGRDIPDTALGKLLIKLGVIHENTREDMLPPIPIGSLGSLLPKPQHCYIQFGKPIDLNHYKDQELEPKELQSIRRKVSTSINSMLSELLLLREQKRSKDSLWRRFLTL